MLVFMKAVSLIEDEYFLKMSIFIAHTYVAGYKSK